MTQPYAARTQEEMKDVLMFPNADGPTIHYYMIRGGREKSNITVWEPGVVGGEYIKSYGHYHRDDIQETYTILQGEGIVLLQERAIDTVGRPIDDEITSVHAIKVKAGDKVVIPLRAGHLAINTGTTWLVTSDDSPVNFSEKDAVSKPGHADYTPYQKLHGAAYYVGMKDGQPTFIKNSNYKVVPPIQIVETK